MLNQPGDRIAVLLTLVFVLAAPVVQPQWFLAVIIVPFSLLLLLIRNTRNLGLALIPIAVLYGIGILPPLIFCCTLTILVIGELAFRGGLEKLYSYLVYTSATLVGCTLVMFYLNVIAPLVVLFGIIVAVLLKAILKEREDAMMLEAMGIAMTMVLIDELNYQAELTLIALAVIIAFTFGYFSYRFKTADVSGLFSGALVGVVLIVFADVRWFLVMLVFFILGAVSTRWKYEYKLRMGVEQSHGGARGYLNVFANGSVALAAAVLWGVTQNTIFLALFVGSVASAAADTMASEIGVCGGRPYLITTFQKVPTGTNGGVTLLGEGISLIGAVIVSLSAYLMGVITLPVAGFCILAGFVGTNIDSVVGAILENRGYIGNAGTNLIATAGGGMTAMILAYFL
jgi:uncharacterized protein (TIGR00297 family)